jgi:hypothetical protein
MEPDSGIRSLPFEIIAQAETFVTCKHRMARKSGSVEC